jgi:hypothetical protein
MNESNTGNVFECMTRICAEGKPWIARDDLQFVEAFPFAVLIQQNRDLSPALLHEARRAGSVAVAPARALQHH